MAATLSFGVPVLSYLVLPELPLMLVFAILGSLLYASLFVSFGATIHDIYSAGNFQGILFLLPMLPLLFFGPILANPHGLVARIGTYFPFSTSGVMVLRLVLSTRVPGPEVAAALALLAATAYLVMRLAGRVFRVALLMYGKNATPREIFRWMRRQAQPGNGTGSHRPVSLPAGRDTGLSFGV